MVIIPDPDYGTAAALFTEKNLVHLLEEVSRMLTLSMEGELFPPENKMWERYPYALALYGKALLKEHQDRSGELHSASEAVEDILTLYGDHTKPWWLGIEQVHTHHKNLLSKKQSTGLTSPDFPALRPAVLYGLHVIIVESGVI